MNKNTHINPVTIADTKPNTQPNTIIQTTTSEQIMPTQYSSPCIAVKNLSLSIGNVKILKNLSLEVQEGEMFIIVGPNGSGKSTLLKALTGLIDYSSDSLAIMGKQLKDISLQERAQLFSYVSQNLENTIPYKVEETVALGRSPWQNSFGKASVNDLEIIMDSMEKTDVLHLSYRIFSSLSGGEQQRVLISRALCQKTKIIFFDEPTSALDYAHQIHVMDTLYELCTQGISIVMVSHDLNLAAMYAHKVLLLHQGEIVTCDAPSIALTQNNLEELYGCPLFVDTHPITQTVRVSYIPKNTAMKRFQNG